MWPKPRLPSHQGDDKFTKEGEGSFLYSSILELTALYIPDEGLAGANHVTALSAEWLNVKVHDGGIQYQDRHRPT